MMQLDLPQELNFENPKEAIRQLWDRQVSFEKQMTYYLRNLDAANFNETGLKDMTAPVYKAISDTEGKLLAVELTAEGAAIVAQDAAGAATTAQITANGASMTASNAAGMAASVALTVDGLTVSNPDGSTTINGDMIKSGTIEGVTLISISPAFETFVEINDGYVSVGDIPDNNRGQLGFDKWEGKVYLQTMQGIPLKIYSGWNMGIEAAETIYIGTGDSGSNNVHIGKVGGTNRIDLFGEVYINGVLQG